jgi:hypothetical protein
LEGDVVVSVVDDVLADSLHTTSVQPHESRLAHKQPPEVELQPVQVIAVDPKRQLGDQVVRAWQTACRVLGGVVAALGHH